MGILKRGRGVCGIFCLFLRGLAEGFDHFLAQHSAGSGRGKVKGGFGCGKGEFKGEGEVIGRCLLCESGGVRV